MPPNETSFNVGSTRVQFTPIQRGGGQRPVGMSLGDWLKLAAQILSTIAGMLGGGVPMMAQQPDEPAAGDGQEQPGQEQPAEPGKGHTPAGPTAGPGRHLVPGRR